MKDKISELLKQNLSFSERLDIATSSVSNTLLYLALSKQIFIHNRDSISFPILACFV